MPTNRLNRYDRVAVALHWIIAALMIFMLVFGEDLMDRHQTGTFYASAHASIGISIFALSLVRLFWRWGHPPPPLPASTKPWEARLSHTLHIVFYFMLIALPLSGWLAFSETAIHHPNLAGASYFGLLPITVIPAAAELPFDAVHGLGGNLMIALVVLHVLAALKHQFIDRDGLLRRMS